MIMRSTDHLKFEAINRCKFVYKIQSITDIQVTSYLQYGEKSDKDL